MNTKLKLLTFSIALFFSLSSCGQTKNNNQHQISSASNQAIDTSDYAILKFDTTEIWLFKNATPASLTQTEIEEIEIILKQCIAAYNPGRQLQFDTISKAHPEYNLKVDNFVINLPRYKRQYIAVINSAGQKEVWVNCFCQHFDTNWRTEILMVEDGGNCYFNLTINLATKTYSKLSVNGEA